VGAKKQRPQIGHLDAGEPVVKPTTSVVGFCFGAINHLGVGDIDRLYQQLDKEVKRWKNLFMTYTCMP
jgi:hypothetical protein